MKTMASKKIWVYLVAAFALVVLSIVNASAMNFAQIVDVEVKGTDVLGRTFANPFRVSAGETIPVRVEFHVFENARDVRVRAWISGEREQQISSDRFIVSENSTESALLSLRVPTDVNDDDILEEKNLVIVIESENDDTEVRIPLRIVRESYQLEVLDVDMSNEVSVGEVLTLDVVLNNIGAEFADETFVRATIEALGVEDRAFFGDLSPTDEPFSRDPFFDEDGRGIDRLDKEDSVERRLFLKIPSDAQPGIYVVEVEAYNKDSSAVITRRVAITGVEDSSIVVAPVHSRSFAVGEEGEYSLTLVNTGNKIRVFELIVDSPSGLELDISDPVVAVPAGSSMTVKLKASADEAGRYDFAVNVHSGAELIKREEFMANVDGATSPITATSPTVLLTVVLAVIFVVLLIVLIVLLTRKPEKAEEAESYY